jgi:hypothetical protein
VRISVDESLAENAVTQPSLFPHEPAEVWVKCRACGSVWLTAIIRPWIKWLGDSTPEQTAKRVICQCGSHVSVVRDKKASAA